MITNFEEFTEELTSDELATISKVCEVLSIYTKSNPIKSPVLVDKVNSELRNIHSPVQINAVRLRKLIHVIRANGTLPVIATSKGYYVSYDVDDVCLQIRSLIERSNSISECASGMMKFT